MLLMRAKPLRGQVGGGWALEIKTFLGPVKRHRAVRRVPFGVQKSINVLKRLKKQYRKHTCETFSNMPQPTEHVRLYCRVDISLSAENALKGILTRSLALPPPTLSLHIEAA